MCNSSIYIAEGEKEREGGKERDRKREREYNCRQLYSCFGLVGPHQCSVVDHNT